MTWCGGAGGTTPVGTARRGVAKSSTSLRDSDTQWDSETSGDFRTSATAMEEVRDKETATAV